MSFEVIIPFLKPIEQLLSDRTVSEIMVNPDGSVWMEERGHIVRQPGIEFEEGALLTSLEVIANRFGKKLDADSPILNLRLPDGSRMAALIPPVLDSDEADALAADAVPVPVLVLEMLGASPLAATIDVPAIVAVGDDITLGRVLALVEVASVVWAAVESLESVSATMDSEGEADDVVAAASLSVSSAVSKPAVAMASPCVEYPATSPANVCGAV